MASDNLPSPLGRNDYAAIEDAVMETDRGRWFLAEYARRNRHSDTERVLGAIETLQNRLTSARDDARLDRMRNGLIEMARAIAVTHVEIERIRPEGFAATRLDEATGELDAIVQATEDATSTILAATEQIQEHAWTMRERGESAAACDTLDACATEIYAACGFQDITAQRTRKVIDTLNFVENRIKSMMEAWDIDMPAVEAPSAAVVGGMAPAPEKFWPADENQQAAIDLAFESVEAEVPIPGLNEPPFTTHQQSAPSAFANVDNLPVDEKLRMFR